MDWVEWVDWEGKHRLLRVGRGHRRESAEVEGDPSLAQQAITHD